MPTVTVTSDTANTPNSHPEVNLTDITIYPIKSVMGLNLTQALVTPMGLLKDRGMMLVDEKQVFISQRKFPQMALIQLEMHGNSITVSAPDMSPLTFSNADFSADFSSENIAVEVWGSYGKGFVANSAINQWFSSFLQFPVKLVRYDETQPRKTDPEFSKNGDIVSYADGFPLLLISQASLTELNSRLTQPVSMRSFRPNLVVEGCEAFAEDNWKSIRIGKVEFDLVKACSRCVLTTVDPETGIKREDKEPLKTLSQYRRSQHGVLFGMNLIPRTLGHVSVNSSVEILI